jgi:hypothetical protein
MKISQILVSPPENKFWGLIFWKIDGDAQKAQNQNQQHIFCCCLNFVRRNCGKYSGKKQIRQSGSHLKAVDTIDLRRVVY